MPIGIHDDWAAIRDDRPSRCYAVARPFAVTRGAANVAFFAVTRLPGGHRQLHARLSRPRGPDAPVRLWIDGRAIFLGALGLDAWAREARADNAVIAAMRGAAILRIESVSATGRPFRDIYRLPGAASAIDAATLACLAR